MRMVSDLICDVVDTAIQTYETYEEQPGDDPVRFYTELDMVKAVEHSTIVLPAVVPGESAKVSLGYSGGDLPAA